MKASIKKITVLVFILLLSLSSYSQNSEIVKLDVKRTYKYISYHENGQIKQEIGFYAKKPFNSIEEFEAKLKVYKIKKHGTTKAFYPNGQLKEIVVYKKGKVIEFAKQYFEDGEEFSVGTETKPEFQFSINEQNQWFADRIAEIEHKYEINLSGNAVIVLFISADGHIKDIKVRTKNVGYEQYLIEIAEQIEVKKPAHKDGKDIGTKYGFKIEM